MSKKTEAEPAPPEASESPPEQPVSPAAAGDGKGEAKGEAPAKKGTAKRKSPGTSGGKDPTPKSFATTLAARTERSLADMYRIQDGIPEEVIEWSLKCFGHFDASTNGFNKEITRDPLLDDMDPWELREALFLGGRHEVTDETVVQMIRSVGKVEHSDVRINFREFVTMCWKWFFEEPPEDDEASDVRDAFEILGGGPGTEGEVETRKLKLFATELNLTIDVDKFVGEVDEDGSGKVDYDEFCKLFADSKIDTNLHDTGEMWLRHDKDEILKKTPAVASGRRSASPTGLTINTDEPSVQHPEAPGTASRPDSAFFDARSHEQSVSVVRHRDGFFGDEAPAHVNSAALHAPKMKKVLQNTAPKFERREYYNSVDTKCRRGWRYSQMNRNNPKVEGYNFYNVKSSQAQELESTGVKLRKRGAEYTIKEHSSARINVRLSTEMRCRRQMKLLASKPPSRAATAMGLSSDTSLGMTTATTTPWQGNSRPQTVPTEGIAARRHNVSALSIGAQSFNARGIGGEGMFMRSRGLVSAGGSNRGLTSSWAASTIGTTRNYSYKDPLRPRDWLSNMKTRPDPLPTADLLKLAASAGLYEGRGFQEKVGPGYSFLDD